jgi:hypothetical protein
MAGLRYLCCSDTRRAALEQRPDLNGIDFLEVGDLDPTELDAAEAAEYARSRSRSATDCSGSAGSRCSS